LGPTDRAQVLYLYNGQFVSSNSCFRNCENVKRLSFKVFLRQDSTSQRQSVALGVSMGRIMKFTLRAEAHWPPTAKVSKVSSPLASARYPLSLQS
jgi:hypothetical protein